MLNRTEEDIVKNWPQNFEETKPIVSIRCTTFNQEKFIGECLDGLLMQQTNFFFQIFVHDDASKDNTANIVREYAAKYPRVIKALCETENQWSKQDGSFTRIVNSNLTGKYVAMCEGDDYWIDPQKLQTQVNFLESHPDYSMIFHDAEIKNEPGVTPVDKVYPDLETREYFATELFAKWTAPTASLLYRREILNIPIKNSKHMLNGDIFLVERAAHYGKVYCINKKMSVYRRQPSGVTWDASKKLERELKYPNHYMTIKKNFPLIDKSVIDDAIWKTLRAAFKKTHGLMKVKFLAKAFFFSPKFFFKTILQKIH